MKVHDGDDSRRLVLYEEEDAEWESAVAAAVDGLRLWTTDPRFAEVAEGLAVDYGPGSS